MKNFMQLKSSRKAFSLNQSSVLSMEELMFVTGGTEVNSGGGSSSSTSGSTCCDSTCVCKTVCCGADGEPEVQ
ncbi:hypothetical protein [uncultured Pedobacter sp.]|uniref:hypothetical protein n=1 Tax=uncultured Pedobacter sp. TaxID=246139 RepID=UPI0025F38DFE|nr:hypothetical protein [uncultured Pedobacter sp.]